MAIKTFINGQENGVITYLGDTEPCAVYVNGERQDNISYIPTLAEGADSVSYTSEYKNNLRTLQIEGNTEQPSSANLFDQNEMLTNRDFTKAEYNGFETIKCVPENYIHTINLPKPIPSGTMLSLAYEVAHPETNGNFQCYLYYEDGTTRGFPIYSVSSPTTDFQYRVETTGAEKNVVGVQFNFYDRFTYRPYYFKNIMLYEAENLYDISKVNGASLANTTTPDVAGNVAYGTVTNGVLNLAYGVYDRNLIWTGSKIPIKQGGKYRVLFDFMCESSMNGSYGRIQVAFRNLTKGESKVFSYITDDNVRDVWQTKNTSSYVEIPDTWVGDNVYLQLQVLGNGNQYSKMPIYAKNIIISYNEAKPYEPYVPPISIANPRTITNCGNSDIEVVARGVNLFDIDNPFLVVENSYHLAFAPKIENGIIYSGGRLSLSDGAYLCVKTDGKSKYTFSYNVDFDEATETTRVHRFGLFSDVTNGVASKYSLFNRVSGITKGKKTVTIDCQGYEYVGVTWYSNTRYGIEITDLQIEKGDVATPYEPYFNSTVSIPANVVLESGANDTLLELAKIGDYADTITIDRVNNEVKYIQRICRVRPFVNVGGTLEYGGTSGGNPDEWDFPLNKNAQVGIGKCEFSPIVEDLPSENEYGVFIFDTVIIINTPKSLGLNSPEALDSYLMQTGNFGLSIFYVLEEPIEWTITDNMESMGSTVNLKTNLLEWAKNTKNQTNIIEITSTPSVSKTSVNYAKWGGVPNENNT